MARRLAADGIDADLMVANNALFRVPDADDFLAGFALLLNAEGVATFEIAPTSCLTPRMAEQFFAANRLRIFDVEPLKTPRGSLQVFRLPPGFGVATRAVGWLDAGNGASGRSLTGARRRLQRFLDQRLDVLRRRGGADRHRPCG